MKKGLIWLGTTLLAMSLSLGSIQAAETDGSLGLTFEGNSGEFITYEEGNTYENMAPGEARTQTITLTNEDHREMKFYVRGEYTNPLGEGSANGNIVYDISFSNNDEAFFNGKMGGVTQANMNALENNYLLKTLKQGETTTIRMAISIDGDSMDNSYQNSQGTLNLVFSVEYDEETPLEKVVTTVKKIPVINKIVDTGDTTSIGILLGVFGASIVLIIILLINKVRKRKEQ